MNKQIPPGIIALTFALFGVVWIFAGEYLADALFDDSFANRASFEVAKGLLFVGLASVGVYVLSLWLWQSRFALFSAINDVGEAIFVVGADGRIHAANDLLLKMARGGARLGKASRLPDLGWPETAIAVFDQNLKLALSNETSVSAGIELHTPEGNRDFIYTVTPGRHSGGPSEFAFVSLRDVQAEERIVTELARTKFLLDALADANRAMLRAQDPQGVIQAVCDSLVAGGKFPLVWFGTISADSHEPLKATACAGTATAYIDGLCITWDDQPTGMGPSGMAVKTGQAQAMHDVMTAVSYEPWRKRAQKFGVRSAAAVPIFDQGRIFGVLSIYASVVNAFRQPEMEMLETLALDMGFVMRVLSGLQKFDKVSEERDILTAKASASELASVSALAQALEYRDPYTAGHQRRVAEIATAIAAEMNLPAQDVDGLRIAGTLHDIGKLSIPSDILTKPSRLSAAEFELVKGHCEAGEKIVRAINFDWPVARVILEHHEKLDGSGYPRGLKGDQISLGAQIISVADIYEAMTAHRPYRAALGAEAAKTEILKGRGRTLNADAVDACIKLFLS